MDQAAIVSQIIQNLAIVLAVIIGGFWALYRHRRLREEKLSIECQVNVMHSARSINDRFVVSLAFRMKNAGARALKLAPDGEKPYDVPLDIRGEGMPWAKKAFRNCELVVWRLNTWGNTSDALLSITNEAQASKVRLSDEPINLLAESRINPASFWLEPEEIAQSVVSLALSPGYYVGQVITLFDMRPITGVKSKTKYTFDVFTFTFEVPALENTALPEVHAHEGSALSQARANASPPNQTY